MSKSTVRIATRKSPLALWQANYVADQLRQHWPELSIELVPMLTSGDRFLKDKLSTIGGGKGLFVKELEEALLDGRADIAVHSMKDVPAQLPSGLILDIFCPRGNPMDVLVSARHVQLMNLPQRAVVGTSSLRRQSQLLAVRPDLQIKSLRGNINTRISKLEAGEFDAIVLAAAGLERMAMQQVITEQLSDDIMLPACGQGIMGVEYRQEDTKIKQLLTPINDAKSTICITAERWVNARLGGNCHVPLAVYCTLDQETIELRARLLSDDGKTILSFRKQGQTAQAQQLAEQCAEALLAQGAAKLLGMA